GVYRDRGGRILGLFGISHDITELRRAQETIEQTRESLFRSQKMEAVGQLTGGIAHDFNNILAIILGNVELLRAYLPKDRYADEIIDAVLRATLHGRDLTGHLLAFSRRRLLNPQPVNVNALVDSSVKLLGRTLGSTIRIITETRDDAGVAFVDPAALEAAILNIALNARDAMPDGDDDAAARLGRCAIVRAQRRAGVRLGHAAHDSRRRGRIRSPQHRPAPARKPRTQSARGRRNHRSAAADSGSGRAGRAVDGR